jgi:Fe-S-cluster containining protein
VTLPTLVCQRKCQASCGPIRATQREREHILRTHGRMLGVDHTGRRCRLLTDDGACAVYADRPMICRLYGLVESMRCPHGCAPERWLSEAEAFTALSEAAVHG